ncbi:MAG: hypothetical protein WB770_09200 [Acidimicrobiales bacterium]
MLAGHAASARHLERTGRGRLPASGDGDSPGYAVTSYHVERWAERRQARRRALVHGLRLKRIPGLRPTVLTVQRSLGSLAVVTAFRRRRVARDLRRLHDIIAETPFAGSYWIWAGLLLGWAREGAILAHDLRDVDLAYRVDDAPKLEAALPALVAAGFRPVEDHRNERGELTFQRLRKGITVYEFHGMEPVGGALRYTALWCDPETHAYFELISELADQPLEPFVFLGRRWLKHADHDA